MIQEPVHLGTWTTPKDGVHGYGREKANYHWLVYPVFLNASHKNFCIARGQDLGPGLCEYSIPWFIAIG
jgi:hypothetical protein